MCVDCSAGWSIIILVRTGAAVGLHTTVRRMMAWDLMLLMNQAVVSDTCSACTCPAKFHGNP
jgi:hypothetical protein